VPGIAGSFDRRRFVRSALLIATGALAVGCGSDRGALTAPSFGAPATSTPAPGTGRDRGGQIGSVAMVGDSITAASERPLADGFGELGLEVRALDAADGRRIAVGGPSVASGLDAVAAIAATDPPDLWVIALGSNDVFQYAGAEEYLSAIGALLSAIPSGAPVVWVDTYLEDDPARSDDFNQAVRDAVAFRGEGSVANWAAVAPGEGVLRDGIHPSPDGAEQFAAVVMAAVEDWLG
jgi:lysophospholipase L1-like esterase